MLSFGVEVYFFMNTNHTREKMIATAIRQIRSKDIQSFSIRNLVQELNLTTGSFYKNFKNKEDLFLAIAEDLSQSLYEQLSEVNNDKKRNPQKSLSMLGNILIEFFFKEPRLTDFLFFNTEVLNSFSFYKETQGSFKLFQMTMDLISQIIKDNKLQISKTVFFIQIWSFIEGYAILIKNKAVIKDPLLIEQTLNTLIKGLKNE